MSFTIYPYTSDDGEAFKIKLDEQTATAGGFTAGALAGAKVFVKVSKGNKEHGIRPRGVRLSRETTGTIGKFLPVATEAQIGTLLTNGTVTIGANTWTVTSAQPEDY